MIIIVAVISIAAHGISKELKRVEARLVGSDDDEHDQKIDEQVSRASEGYWKRLEILKTEKEKLPKIDTWDIDTIPNWEQYLIERAKSLRGLINMTRYAGDAIKTRDVPMDYYFAHALAEFAQLTKRPSPNGNGVGDKKDRSVGCNAQALVRLQINYWR